MLENLVYQVFGIHCYFILHLFNSFASLSSSQSIWIIWCRFRLKAEPCSQSVTHNVALEDCEVFLYYLRFSRNNDLIVSRLRNPNSSMAVIYIFKSNQSSNFDHKRLLKILSFFFNYIYTFQQYDIIVQYLLYPNGFTIDIPL